MTIATTLALIAALFVLAVTPGPAVFAIIARALSSGVRPVLAFIIGVTIGDLVLLLLAVLGLAAAAQALGELFVVVKLVGGAYLIWLGWRMWTAEPQEAAMAALPERAGRKNLVAGLLLTLGNPKAIVFYAAFLPTFIDLTRITIGDVLVIVTAMVIVLPTVMLGYAALAARARGLFKSRRAMRSLNRGAGTIMIGAGVVVATR